MDEQTKAALRPITARAYAVQTCVMALMETHPDPQAMRDAIGRHSQNPMAILGGLSWPEKDVEAFHHTLALLQSLMPD